MSVIFIDGPDFSGKTTTAMAMGSYSEWSITNTGQALRKYFESAEPTTEATLAHCRKLWTDWFRIGKDRKTVLHVDRSPLSTYAEQIMGDAENEADAFIAYLADEIRQNGPMVIKFLSVSTALLAKREDESKREKDARECKRDPFARNALYHRAFMDMAERLGKHCKVKLTHEAETDIITLEATYLERSLLSYFSKLEMISNPPDGGDLATIEIGITGRSELQPLNPSLYMTSYPVIIEALNLCKEWIVETQSILGYSVSRSGSLVNVRTLHDAYSSDGRTVDREGTYCLISGYLNRIRTVMEKSVSGVFTVEDAVEVIGEYDVEHNGRVTNPYSSALLAALFITHYQKAEDEWHIN